MTSANAIMLGLGCGALLAGLAVLLRRGANERQAVVRRIAGTMGAALGLVLIIFAIGLSAPPQAGN